MTEGNDRKIRENEAQMEDIKREITLSNEARAKIDGVIASLQDELSRANSLRTNISSNVRYRNEEKDIEKVQVDLDGIDIEHAAKARKEFNTRYSQNLERENDVQSKVSGPLRPVFSQRNPRSSLVCDRIDS